MRLHTVGYKRVSTSGSKRQLRGKIVSADNYTVSCDLSLLTLASVAVLSYDILLCLIAKIVF